MSALDEAVGEQIKRLVVLWPVLNARPQHTQEIGQAVMRHASRLTPDDITEGFSRAIENAPTNGWPPGPHEVLGCVLKARETRVAISNGNRVPRNYGGGLTFAQWWHTLPEHEKPQHAALYRLMRGEDPEPVTHTPDGEIAFEDAEWEEAA